MTHLGLHPDITYCDTAGRLIFLDTRTDRYFRLPPHLETAFSAYAGGTRCTVDGLDGLVQRGILVQRTGATRPSPCPPPTTATHSVPELRSSPTRTGPITALEVAMTLSVTKLRLRWQGLQRTLCIAEGYRARKSAHAPPSPDQDERVCSATAAFLAARPLVPIDTCCLPDSLALLMFMARRGLPAQLVIGVTAEPFSAHCWVQWRGLVLNDTVGHVTAHTPIRVL
ncbi:MAG: lasso peptide biosynthesis B2 protein [Lysobacteraceae bacterium]